MRVTVGTIVGLLAAGKSHHQRASAGTQVERRKEDGALGCGSNGKRSSAQPSPGGADASDPTSMAGADAGAGTQVEAAVSAEYRWSECGRIEASARPIAARYAPDGSILVLEETGRLRLFPKGSNTPTMLLPATDNRAGFGLTSEGLSIVSYEDGTRVWYAAADRQPIGAATSELIRIDPPASIAPPNAAAESCADSIFVTDSGAVMTASSTTVCFWESLTSPLLARFNLPTTGGSFLETSAFSNDGFFTLRDDQLIHVDLRGEVAARIDLSGLIEPSSERNWQTDFAVSARTLILSFVTEGGSRFLALDTLSGNSLWEVTLDDQPTPSFMFDPEGSVLLVKGGPILRVADGAVVGRDAPALYGSGILALTSGARRQLRLGEQVAEWDLEQQLLRYLYGSHSSGHPIHDVDVTPDGRHFAAHGERRSGPGPRAFNPTRGRGVTDQPAASIARRCVNPVN
jgi:hypothetical protein